MNCTGYVAEIFLPENFKDCYSRKTIIQEDYYPGRLLSRKTIIQEDYYPGRLLSRKTIIQEDYYYSKKTISKDYR